MKKTTEDVEEYRWKKGVFASDKSLGMNGIFVIPFESYKLCVQASDGVGWEHVSVSLRHRYPNWKEMCFIKDLFWEKEECVVQYHPPKSEYVNNHPYCLHLWRPGKKKFPMPDSILVGIKKRDPKMSSFQIVRWWNDRWEAYRKETGRNK